MSDLTRTNLVVGNNTLSPTLQWSICLDLVMSPVECSHCLNLFCKDCITNWLNNSTECPKKHKFERKAGLDEWIQPVLNKIFIKCPYEGCNLNYAYSTWTNHIKVCKNKSRGIRDETPTGDEIFSWKEVQFFVKDLNNRSHPFVLPLNTTVEELKEKLKPKTGMDVQAQRFACNGKNMSDNRTLEYYGVQPNTTIIQLARLKGGQYWKIKIEWKI